MKQQGRGLIYFINVKLTIFYQLFAQGETEESFAGIKRPGIGKKKSRAES